MYIKYKFGKVGLKIKVSLNLREYSRTGQVEDSKCKFNKKWIFKFESRFEKMLVQWETGTKIYFLVKLTFTYCEYDV